MNDKEIQPLPKGCYVMLHIGTGPSLAQVKAGASLVVTDERLRFFLNDDIWIERLDEELAKHIQIACEPPNYNIHNHAYDRHLYAFVAQIPEPGTEAHKYEGMGRLRALTALSRLIHPTSIGNRYCAWVFHFGLKDSAIHAIQYIGTSPDAIIAPGTQDWLSLKDGQDLCKLMAWLSDANLMHPRVHRAYWNHEYAMRTYYLDLRWILVVSGFEALVSVDEKGRKSKRGNRAQFRNGVSKLAANFGVTLSGPDLDNAYTLRSKVIHAEGFLSQLGTVLPTHEHNTLYESLESLLRLTIRECLLNPTFGDRFRDDATVELNWQS